MKRSQALVLLFFYIFMVILLSACQTQWRGVDDNTSDIVPSTELDNPNEIKMEVWLFDCAHLKNAARMYEERTGIKVNIHDNAVAGEQIELEVVNRFGDSYMRHIPIERYPDTSMYTEQAIAELMAGSGSDIYFVSYMDYENLGRNGLLVDISDWIENDSEFSNDLYFRNVLLSGKTDSGVFAMPIDFSFSRLSATYSDEPLFKNRQMMWREKMTWQEFIYKVEDLGYTQELAYSWTELEVFMHCFTSMASYFIDEKSNTQILYSYEMISLLEECREWRDMGLLADSRDIYTLTVPYSYSAGMYNGTQSAYMLCSIPEGYVRASGYLNYFFAPVPFNGDTVYIDGNYLYPEICFISLYGVNARSPNTEAAQDFLRFLLSEEVQEAMMPKEPLFVNNFAFPINRAVFRGGIEKSLDHIKAYNQSSIEQLEELDYLVLISEAEEIVDQIAYIIMEKPYYKTTIGEVAIQYFLDKITAEEAARQMSDKVGLYLKEQG